MAQYDTYDEPSTIADSLSDALAEPFNSGIDLDNAATFIDPPENAAKIAGYGLLGATGVYQAGKLAKRLLGRSIDTEGFGGNVTGSYESASKIEQLNNNLLQVTKGKKSKMPIEFLKQLKTRAVPIELKAVDSSLNILEEEMSKLKSQGKRVPKVMNDYYLNLQDISPKRKMASAIKERAFRQKIGFKHDGRFIEGKFPQVDPDVKRFLKNKGLSTKGPIPVFEISGERGKKTSNMMSNLIQGGSKDPRVELITKALKENRLNDARLLAKRGIVMYKGKPIKSGRPVKLIKTKNGYTLRFVPSWIDRGGKIRSKKDFVIGGHTQRIQFVKNIGKSGFRKGVTDVIDITTYATAGEKGMNWKAKARLMAAGKPGQKLGIFDPVVTRGTFVHPKPGKGRTVGATDIKPRKRGKIVPASMKKYGKAAKILAKALKAIATKGRSLV